MNIGQHFDSGPEPRLNKAPVRTGIELRGGKQRTGDEIAPGNGTKIVCLGKDLIERNRAEEALARSERNYREVFNAANDAIFIHDAVDWTILDVNETMLRMFGFSREEALRLAPNDSSAGMSPYSATEARQYLAKAVAEGPQVFEWHARKKSGALFWVESP